MIKGRKKIKKRPGLAQLKKPIYHLGIDFGSVVASNFRDQRFKSSYR